jgi:hypothetical protein
MEKKFDKEYATQWDKEVAFLKSKSINPVFVKTGITNIRTYKYTKNEQLFSALKEFYLIK